jgi:protein TonB
MSSYRATAGRTDQAKAIAAVAAVHAMLALVILTGLNVRMVRHAVEQLTTINISEPPPPPVVHVTKPAPKASRAKRPMGASAPKAEPTPVVAPPAPKPILSPIPAAKNAGTGTAAPSGAGAAGTGTGSGGTGNGPGGGGYRDYSRFTAARLVRNLNRGDYRSIAGDRMPRGSAMVSLRVEPDGVPTDCRIVRSSGDPSVDAGLCPLIIARLRFLPALDDQGRPIPYQLQYVATWSL